jgi:SpoIID/LytB domain protein
MSTKAVRNHRIWPGVLILIATVAIPAGGVLGQADVTDADLEIASAGRVIRVGALATDGHVTIMPLEVYVARVLAGEGEPRAADAAQQALAIAIRTYALANLDRHGRDGYDLCDTTHCQVPRPATPSSRRAAMATAGQVLIWHAAIAQVFYSASCGGRSEEASEVWPEVDLPYLRSRPDDVHKDDPPWMVEMTLPDIQRALARAGFAGDRLRDVSIDDRNSSGRVARLHVRGLRPDTISGDQFRAAVGATELRSTAFSMKRRGDRLEFTGRGFGHGVGLCVIGAGRRAVRGESVRAILAQYFPGLELTRLEAMGAKAPAAAPAPVAVAAPAIVPRAGAISVRVPTLSTVSADDLERLATRAHAELTKTLGTSIAPITIQLHESIESFRVATGRPWWVNATAQGTSIDLAPAPVLVQREGVEAALRIALAELLVAPVVADRPLWVRIGAGRYFGRSAAAAAQAGSASRVRCPSDAELTLAVSVTAQREAESRAEACFAREFARTHDWRAVR